MQCPTSERRKVSYPSSSGKNDVYTLSFAAEDTSIQKEHCRKDPRISNGRAASQLSQNSDGL